MSTAVDRLSAQRSVIGELLLDGKPITGGSVTYEITEPPD